MVWYDMSVTVVDEPSDAERAGELVAMLFVRRCVCLVSRARPQQITSQVGEFTSSLAIYRMSEARLLGLRMQTTWSGGAAIRRQDLHVVERSGPYNLCAECVCMCIYIYIYMQYHYVILL